MPQTPNHALRWPAGSDTRNVPRDLGYLAVDVERELDELEDLLGDIAGATSDALANRPTPADAGANTLFVATDGANAGRAFLSTGSAWVELAVNLRLARVLAEAAADVPLQIRGAANQTGDLAQFLDPAGTIAGRITSYGGYGLPRFGTASLPASGAVGTLVYDANTGQVKVKTSGSAATFAAVGGAQKAQGTYLANSTNPRSITVGFAPDLVLVSSKSTQNDFAWIHSTDGTYAQAANSGSKVAGAYLTATGFVIGSTPNQSGYEYSWTAFKFV